jgi:hypothetical protein
MPPFGHRNFFIQANPICFKQIAILPHEIGSTDNLVIGNGGNPIQPFLPFPGAQQVVI